MIWWASVTCMPIAAGMLAMIMWGSTYSRPLATLTFLLSAVVLVWMAWPVYAWSAGGESPIANGDDRSRVDM